MSDFLIFQHHAAENPGRIARWAEGAGLSYTLHRPDLGDLPGDDVENLRKPLVVLGGPYSVTQPPQWLAEEGAWLSDALEAGAPVFAICMGAQLMAHCLGAKVYPLAKAELGWLPIRLAEGSSLEVLQWHELAFELPDGAEALAENDAALQAYQMGPARVACQFHPEWDAQSVAELNAGFGSDSPLHDPDCLDPARHAAVERWAFDMLESWRAAW